MKDSRKIKQYLIILEEELYKLQSKNKLLPSIYTETKYNLEILLVDFQGNQIDKLKDQVYREDTWKKNALLFVLVLAKKKILKIYYVKRLKKILGTRKCYHT